MTIGQEEQLRVEDVLISSLNKFKEQGIEGTDEAIRLVQDARSREEINAEEKISNVVEGKRSPKLSAIKKVVGRLKEQIVNRGKPENQGKETGGEEGDRDDSN